MMLVRISRSKTERLEDSDFGDVGSKDFVGEKRLHCRIVDCEKKLRILHS